MLALFTVEDEEADPPGWDDLYRVGTVAVVHKMIKVPDGTLRILVQGVQRVRLVKPRRGRAVSRRRARGPAGGRPGVARGRGADADGAAAVRADHRADAVPARGAAARRRERRRPDGAHAPDRVDAAPEDRGAPGAARDRRRRGAAAPDRLDPRPRGRDVGARLEDPVAGRERDRQGPAGVLPPAAAEGDPGGARRDRRPAGRDQRAARAARGQEPARSTSPRRRCAR